MEFFKSAVSAAIAKSSSFPYSIGDRVDNEDSIWALHNSTKRDDNSTCSVFVFDINANKSRLPLAKNAARKLRTLRHPGVIRVLDVIENETNIYVITERVTPLSWHVKRKSLSEETIKWGLHSVSLTLKFINQDASSVHGSIRVGSVFTSESGEWKLGGFEVLSSMNEDDAIIYNYGSMVPDANRYAPPEVASGWAAIKKNPLSAADSYGLGVLIYEAFNGSFRGTDQLSQPGDIPKEMVQVYRRLVNANPKMRLSAGHFVDQGKKTGGFFQTPLIQITEGAESLGLKNDQEREEFLRELDGLTDDFPEDFFKMKILPELLKSIEFGGGGPSVFGAITKIGLKMSDDEFEARLVPVIIRLFNSPDRAMRVCLLDNLPQMIDRISQKDVNNKIFPPMTTGFTDTAPVVREQTVKAVLTVITKLSDRTINGELLRFLAKTANDEQPGIRTNTTICLGKIAKNLGAGSRAKVLIAAFGRSLRDPFVHARNAALMALNATSEVFTDEDCATKILPIVCPSLVDKEKPVREQAFKTMDTYMARVRKHASSMPDSAQPPSEIAAGNSAVAPAARIGNQNDTSWAGWAISSFTNKLTAAKGEMDSAAANGIAITQQPPQTQSLPASGRATPTRGLHLSTQKPTALRPSSSHGPTSTTTSKSTIITSPHPSESNRNAFEDDAADNNVDDGLDAWGEMDDDGDNFFDASSKSATTASPVKTSTTFDDKGEPDFAGWLAAQNKSKSKSPTTATRPLPKGLSKPAPPPPSSSSTTTTTTINGANLTVRPATTRSMSTGGTTTAAAATLAAKKASAVTRTHIVAAKKQTPTSLKPKEDVNDDDWGDAWD